MKTYKPMSIPKKLIPTIIFTILIFTLTGCGNSSLFKNLAGGGEAKTGLSGANQALESGNNEVAITQADTVLADNNSTSEEKQEASLIKGQAILGANDITAPKIALILDSTSGSTTNMLELLPRLPLNDALAAANALNLSDLDVDLDLPTDLGASLGLSPDSSESSDSLSIKSIKPQATDPTLTSNIYNARLIANLTVMSELFQTPFLVSGNIISLKPGYTVKTALDYLYPEDPSHPGILRYASIVAVTYPYTGQKPSTQAFILKIINACVYIHYINSARKPGNPYIYVGSDKRKIRSTSTDEEILAAIQFEILKVKL